MQDKTMGNQQERLLGWLGGIIDGEGSFITSIHSAKEPYWKHPIIRCSLKVEMTHEDTIKRIRKIIKLMGLDINLISRQHTAKQDTFQIKINGSKSLSVFLPQIIPYLFTKRKQAKIMLQYSKSRNKTVGNNGRINGQYTRKEIDLAVILRTINRGESPETIRQAFWQRKKI